MRLTPAQLDQYHRDGFLTLPSVFSREKIDAALDHLAPLLEQRCPENYREKATDVRGHALATGHYLPEEAPAETAEALAGFFAAP